MDRCFTSAIVVAAGKASRMDSEINKQFILLGGLPVVMHSILELNKSEYIDELIVVIREDEREYFLNKVLNKFQIEKRIIITNGGQTRQESVFNGLGEVDSECGVVLIQDGARPFLRQRLISESIESAIKYGASCVGVKSIDTMKTVDNDGFIIESVDRDMMYKIQTPQTFRYDIIERAHEKAKAEEIIVTDDSSLVHRYSSKVKIVQGEYDNIKITTEQDLIVAEKIIENKDY